MSLPDKGWTGYGKPDFTAPNGLTSREVRPDVAFGDRLGVARIEIHDRVAEHRLRNEGIKPELRAYLAGISQHWR